LELGTQLRYDDAYVNRKHTLSHLSLQLAVFQQNFNSELAYDADAGQDSASAPSRRQGVELSGQYRPLRGEPRVGVTGYQSHPLEPLSGVLKVTVDL
jgi:hypothetical protein